MIAKPDFPAANAAEAVRKLREGPQDALPYASSGVGAITHFRAGSHRRVARLGGRFPHVPYPPAG